MKKILLLLIILVSAFFVTGCEKTPTLNDIAKHFNNREEIKSYKEMGYNYEATVSGNKLILSASGEYVGEVSLEYTLKDNVLSGDFNLGEDTLITGIFLTNYLINDVESFKGYKNDDLAKSLTDERILEYTLEKEGLSYKLDDDRHLEVKVDITKKIPLLDFSNVYITVENLEELKEYINEGSAQTSEGYVIMHTYTSDGVTEAIISEKDKLTKCSLNSLKSLVEVLFDSKDAVKYLEDNYKDISIGNKEFSGFKMDTKVSEDEVDYVPDGYKSIKVTIDQELVKKAINK